MNKFLKKISLVGLLLSTSCGYSQVSELPGAELQANVKDSSTGSLDGANCELDNGGYTCSHDVTVGTLDNSKYNLDTTNGTTTIKDKDNNTTTFLTRDDSNYTWSGTGYSLSTAKFAFAGQTLTLKCKSETVTSPGTDEESTTYSPSTFTVTQFGEVICPGELTLEPTTTGEGASAETVDNVLLLEPGSKVGSSNTGESLSVEKGIIDLSKYFKDTNALKQGQKIYMTLRAESTEGVLKTTSKIKLLSESQELGTFESALNTLTSNVDEGYFPVFKNIKLGNSAPSFTQPETELTFSTIHKLFDCEFDTYINKIFDESESPIDVNKLLDEEGKVVITTYMLEKLINTAEDIKLTNTDQKPVTLDFSDVTLTGNPADINLSKILSDPFEGTVTLEGLPTDNGITIETAPAKDVVLELADGNVITELVVPNGATTSVSGTGKIIETDVATNGKLIFKPGSKIKLGGTYSMAASTQPPQD